MHQVTMQQPALHITYRIFRISLKSRNAWVAETVKRGDKKTIMESKEGSKNRCGGRHGRC